MVEVNLTDGPCGWVIDPAASDCCPAWADYSPATQTRAATMAAVWMWAATGRLYGQCETTVQLCNTPERLPTYRAYPVSAPGGGGWSPYMMDGVWFNGPLGGRSCCTSRCELILPGHVENTAAVIEVIVEGEPLTAGEYQIYDYGTLVRLDGQCWPVCCNAAGDAAIEVTYGRGEPVPLDVRYGAEVMACEFAAACTPGAECRLPRRVSSVTQLGTSVDFADLPGFADPQLGSGLVEVDDIIKARNPYGMTAPVRLTNPNRQRARRPM
jgi:hypothetical protein